jgi:geranylgeranyl pyrophosphate synthase
MKQADKSTRTEMLEILENGKIDKKEKLRRFVQENKGREYANQQAELYIQKAQNCLNRYEDSPYKDSLVLLSNFITCREV